ncbi:MAG: PD-(D/E)XK nuclease family protein [Candidatus Palauibacterales bacterium]|nr:PD-(D/E)XK nuclease family protein [Candidatus Palauibacterales bacterium]MDP2531039.1 PD-(D/E)XK nuclease family protein [Candidatus Palauibacterales bacterium]MDP2583520.1 PD-(D/E)XK nuclease family protein [Candidatus Palauibacterales bacterium]
MRRLSSSSLKMYRRCPQQWKLKYVDRLPEAPKPFFNLGTAVHAALEAFYRGRVAGPPPLDEVLAAFREAFDPEAYPTEEETERRRADGLAMTRAFYEKHAAGFRPALAVEKHLFFEVEGVAFTGYVDRIDKLGEARIGIVDYKTGGSFDLDRVRTEPQLTLYQLGTEQKFGMDVGRLALYHVPSQTPFEVERHGEEQVERVRGMVREAARGIEAGAFEPKPGHHCRWCDFRPFCPAFADEYPENWLQEPSPPAPTHAEAAALADRYGELKAREKELSRELAEVRERLEAFFEATGERAASGAGYRVKASRKEEWRIGDDEALRELLEPLGLWERVLTTRVDWRRKAALAEDAELPEEVREACRELASRKVTWRLTPGEVEGEGDSEE